MCFFKHYYEWDEAFGHLLKSGPTRPVADRLFVKGEDPSFLLDETRSLRTNPWSTSVTNKKTNNTQAEAGPSSTPSSTLRYPSLPPIPNLSAAKGKRRQSISADDVEDTTTASASKRLRPNPPPQMSAEIAQAMVAVEKMRNERADKDRAAQRFEFETMMEAQKTQWAQTNKLEELKLKVELERARAATATATRRSGDPWGERSESPEIILLS